jgi:predicted nucleic-acid-binding Zn-ribbon protein
MAHCPKCNGSMSEGFIVDHGDYGTAHVSTFQAGQPRKSFWTGLKQNKEEQVAVTTLRCGRCGYLESYAKG